MGELTPEAILKETIYEAGALPRSTESVVLLMQPNKAELDFVALVRIFVNENEIDDENNVATIVHNVAESVFNSAPQVLGISIWFFVNSTGISNRRFAATSRADFDARVPLKVSSSFKAIYQLIERKLKAGDKLRLSAHELSYPKLDLLLRIGFFNEESLSMDKTQESLRRAIFEISEVIRNREPLIGSLSVVVFPQTLTTCIDLTNGLGKYDSQSIRLDARSEVSSRINHVDLGGSW